MNLNLAFTEQMHGSPVEVPEPVEGCRRGRSKLTLSLGMTILLCICHFEPFIVEVLRRERVRQSYHVGDSFELLCSKAPQSLLMTDFNIIR